MRRPAVDGHHRSSTRVYRYCCRLRHLFSFPLLRGTSVASVSLSLSLCASCALPSWQGLQLGEISLRRARRGRSGSSSSPLPCNCAGFVLSPRFYAMDGSSKISACFLSISHPLLFFALCISSAERIFTGFDGISASQFREGSLVLPLRWKCGERVGFFCQLRVDLSSRICA